VETDPDLRIEKEKKYLIPVAFAEEGAVVMIGSIRGGQSIRKRFADRGFLVGEYIRVVKNCRFGGPMLLEVRGTRYAVGRGEAQKILVDDRCFD
jgi:Fe2+ transport system protein FeoA